MMFATLYCCFITSESLYVCLSDWLPVCLHVYLSDWLSVWLSVCEEVIDHNSTMHHFSKINKETRIHTLKVLVPGEGYGFQAVLDRV